MEKKKIFRKVGTIMAELNEQYHYLAERPENVNDLELELFLANSNFLTDHIQILKKLNAARQQQPAGSGTDTAATAVKTEIPSPAPSNIVNKPSDTIEEEVPEAPSREDALAGDNSRVDDQQFPLQEELTEPPAAKAEALPEVQAAEPVPVDEIVKEVVIPEKTVSVEPPVREEEPAAAPTINELMSAQIKPSTVGRQFTSSPVTDLKSIISLNDKLLFVKELFNGYSLAYSEAIELLNRFDNFEAADNFLKVNYAAKNNWSDKQGVVDKLYEILNRRFAR